MGKLAKVEVLLPKTADERLDELLVFDASFLDTDTQRELVQLFPKIEYVRRARKERYLEKGCLSCSKPDPTVAIAARLRRHGSSWAEIFEITGMDSVLSTRAVRKRFEAAVLWKLQHLNAPPRRPSQRYGAGGFCDRCYLNIRYDLAKRIRKMHEGRNAEEETAALTRRFDLAQWLLNGDEE